MQCGNLLLIRVHLPQDAQIVQHSDVVILQKPGWIESLFRRKGISSKEQLTAEDSPRLRCEST